MGNLERWISRTVRVVVVAAACGAVVGCGGGGHMAAGSDGGLGGSGGMGAGPGAGGSAGAGGGPAQIALVDWVTDLATNDVPDTSKPDTVEDKVGIVVDTSDPAAFDPLLATQPAP